MKNNIGIVGGGQLGRMMAFAAKQLGFTVTVVDPTPASPAGQVVDHQIVAPYNDEKAIRELAKMSDYLTFEIELANAAVLDDLAKKGLSMHPSAKTLEIIKDKLLQKKFLREAGLPVADFTEIEATSDSHSGEPSDSRISFSAVKKDSGQARMTAKQEIAKIAKKFGYPMMLKARFDAYDGRGNAIIPNEKGIDAALQKLSGRKLYVEKNISFTKELAVMVARNTKGDIATYPVVETIHQNNICHIVLSPAPVDEKIAAKAEKLAIKTIKRFGGAGVFGIEMFLTKDGKVVINEIAPRVHNSGHYTTEACITSQFEQHIRAVTGLPLGSTAMKVPAAVMINILGERTGAIDVKGLEKVLAIPNVSVHIYGKMETRLERKMGHITVIGDTASECLRKAKKARKLLSI